jgi:hypothetical protein
MRIDQFTDEDLQRMRLAVPKVERLASREDGATPTPTVTGYTRNFVIVTAS